MSATPKKLKSSNTAVLQNNKKLSRIYIHNYPPKEIRDAILSLHGGNCPLEELIAVGEATFQFIYNTDMDLDQKNAFVHLERLFDFYKNLLRSPKKKIIMINRN